MSGPREYETCDGGPGCGTCSDCERKLDAFDDLLAVAHLASASIWPRGLRAQITRQALAAIAKAKKGDST